MRSMCLIAVSLAAAALSGCVTTTIPTNADKYNVDPKAASQLRPQQTVSIVNAYKGPSDLNIKMRGNTLVIDRRQLTETAIAMLTRGLEKQGISVAPEAQKTILVQVRPTGFTTALFRYTGRVTLAVRLGDGQEINIPQENLHPTSLGSAFDGAVVTALNELLEHEYFVAYLNR